jgi:tetratricopeptide (TPR) repeat protein
MTRRLLSLTRGSADLAIRASLLALALVLCLVGEVYADQSDPRLPGLFRELRQAPDDAAAKPVEAAIWAAWLQSGSPSADLLMTRGLAAEDAKDYSTARELFDVVVELEPDFAEAWNRRAAIRFRLGDYAGALGDLQRALTLEPRHFGALMGLAEILEEEGQLKAAREAFRRALALNPHLLEAAEKVRALELELEGRGI